MGVSKAPSKTKEPVKPKSDLTIQSSTDLQPFHSMLPSPPSTCTLRYLCPEDKQKVAKLLQQVVDLGEANQKLKETAEKDHKVHEEKVAQLQTCNQELVQENVSLKAKLTQMLVIMRSYQQKVTSLDAATRAPPVAPAVILAGPPAAAAPPPPPRHAIGAAKGQHVSWADLPPAAASELAPKQSTSATALATAGGTAEQSGQAQDQAAPTAPRQTPPLQDADPTPSHDTHHEQMAEGVSDNRAAERSIDLTATLTAPMSQRSRVEPAAPEASTFFANAPGAPYATALVPAAQLQEHQQHQQLHSEPSAKEESATVAAPSCEAVSGTLSAASQGREDGLHQQAAPATAISTAVPQVACATAIITVTSQQQAPVRIPTTATAALAVAAAAVLDRGSASSAGGAAPQTVSEPSQHIQQLQLQDGSREHDQQQARGMHHSWHPRSSQGEGQHSTGDQNFQHQSISFAQQDFPQQQRHSLHRQQQSQQHTGVPYGAAPYSTLVNITIQQPANQDTTAANGSNASIQISEHFRSGMRVPPPLPQAPAADALARHAGTLPFRHSSETAGGTGSPVRQGQQHHLSPGRHQRAGHGPARWDEAAGGGTESPRQRDAPPSPPGSHHRHQSPGRRGEPRQVMIDAAALRSKEEEVPVFEVGSMLEDEALLPQVSPLLVGSGRGGAVSAAAANLMSWQVQEGLATPSRLAGNHALRFDPSIGHHGAFYFMDVPKAQEPEPQAALHMLAEAPELKDALPDALAASLNDRVTWALPPSEALSADPTADSRARASPSFTSHITRTAGGSTSSSSLSRMAGALDTVAWRQGWVVPPGSSSDASLYPLSVNPGVSAGTSYLFASGGAEDSDISSARLVQRDQWDSGFAVGAGLASISSSQQLSCGLPNKAHDSAAGLSHRSHTEPGAATASVHHQSKGNNSNVGVSSHNGIAGSRLLLEPDATGGAASSLSASAAAARQQRLAQFDASLMDLLLEVEQIDSLKAPFRGKASPSRPHAAHSLPASRAVTHAGVAKRLGHPSNSATYAGAPASHHTAATAAAATAARVRPAAALSCGTTTSRSHHSGRASSHSLQASARDADEEMEAISALLQQ